MIYIFARQPERAIEVVKKALEMDHQFLRLRLMLMSAYLAASMTNDAIREAQSLPETEGRAAIFPMSIMGCAYADSGQRSAALQIVEKLLALADQYSPALVQAAATCARLGDKDRAFELIHLKVDARFDPLRDDRRFDAIMKRLGLE